MNKQERIEKMAQQGRDELIVGNYQGKNDIERLCKALHRIGYINGADFVEWLCKEFSSAGDFVSADKEAILEALQEYLKGE